MLTAQGALLQRCEGSGRCFQGTWRWVTLCRAVDVSSRGSQGCDQCLGVLLSDAVNADGGRSGNVTPGPAKSKSRTPTAAQTQAASGGDGTSHTEPPVSARTWLQPEPHAGEQQRRHTTAPQPPCHSPPPHGWPGGLETRSWGRRLGYNGTPASAYPAVPPQSNRDLPSGCTPLPLTLLHVQTPFTATSNAIGIISTAGPTAGGQNHSTVNVRNSPAPAG